MFVKASFSRRNLQLGTEIEPIGLLKSGGRVWFFDSVAARGAAERRGVLGFSGELKERPLPDSNRGWRICNPPRGFCNRRCRQHFRRERSAPCTGLARVCQNQPSTRS